jgi:hypothetical protein
MATKSTRHFVRIFAVFVSILFFNFSCEDHKIALAPPVLKTLPVTQKGTQQVPVMSTIYKLEVLDTGTRQVSEYGVLYHTYYEVELESDPTPVTVPTVENSVKHPFSETFGVGLKELITDSQFPLRTYVFQRAYAILDDGSVIYGAIVKTRAGVIQ